MKTEEQIFYKKVYIHSEDDLPKSNGLYVIWNNTAKTILNNVLFDSSSNCKSYWMEYIDWYLLPVTLPSEEEIERETPAYCGLADEAKAFQAGATWLKSRLTDK